MRSYPYIMPRPERRYELMRKRLELFTRTLQGVEDGDVRALHRARVASRRLRELIPVLHLDDDTAAKLSKRLRKVTSRLGGVRELDVLRQLVDGLGAQHPRPAVDLVRAAIDRDRHEARERLGADSTFEDLRRLAGRLREALDAIGDDGGPRGTRRPAREWNWALDARVARRATRLRAAIDGAGTAYNPERLHDVRITLKKLRYALELAADARGLKTTTELSALRRGQDLLGNLHDLQMLIARGRGVRAETTDRVAARDLDRFVDALEADCRHLHAHYVGERDALMAICDRLTPARASAARPSRVRRSA